MLLSTDLLDSSTMTRLPFYYEIKLLFLLWLQLPGVRGATILFKECVEPYLVDNERRIDQVRNAMFPLFRLWRADG
jgi:hypothetical protein